MCVCCACFGIALTDLDDAVLGLRRSMLAAFPEMCNVPNFLQGRYYRDAVKNYGVAALLSVCMEEMLHGLPKQRVSLFFSLSFLLGCHAH